MPVPNWTTAPTAPIPAQQGDVWFNTTSGLLHIHNGTSFVRASGGDSNGNTVSAIGANLNPSQALNGFLFVPVISGSAGTPTVGAAAYTGQVPMAYDPVASRLWIQASGGNWKSAAFA